MGKLDKIDNPLKHAPHTIAAVSADNWPHKYPREQAAFPAKWLYAHRQRVGRPQPAMCVRADERVHEVGVSASGKR
jgi:hypothetical protein